jgi:hypothetical protein
MSARPGHDLSALIKWTARDEWRGRVDSVMAEHFEPAMAANAVHHSGEEGGVIR